MDNRVSTNAVEALFRRAAGGCAQSQDQLFERLYARFRLIANHRLWDRVEAEEAVQEALLAIAREYRALEITVSFSAWAHRVLEHRILAVLERRIRRGEQAFDEGEHAPSAGDGLDPLLRTKLLGCLRKICRAHRQYARVLVLHFQGFRTEEICGRMDAAANTVYSALHRGRMMLRRCLETGGIG